MPFDYVVDRDARQHRQPRRRPQRRGVLARRDRRHDAAGGALSQVGVRPGVRLDHRHAARQRAGGRRGIGQGALRAGRAHRLRQRAAAGQPRRLHPAGHRTRRPRPQRPHDRVGLRPEPRPRHDPDAGEQRARSTTPSKYPGLFFIDAHQQSSGYFFPPEPGRGAERDLALRARRDPERDRAERSSRRSTTRPAQYRNYNTYDLFVPEYGDTVPALLMGGAGMTYEKGNNENYGKQVYDHYLAMDTTVNAVAADEDAPDDGLGRSSGRRRSTRARAARSRTTRRSARRRSTCSRSARRPSTRTRTSTSAATTTCRASTPVTSRRRSRTSSSSASTSTGSTAPSRWPASHRFGNFDINAVQGGPSPALTETTTLPGRDAVHPDRAGRPSTGSRRCSARTRTCRSTTSTTR